MDELIQAAAQMICLSLSRDEICYALQAFGADNPQKIFDLAVEELAIESQAESVLRAVREKP